MKRTQLKLERKRDVSNFLFKKMLLFSAFVTHCATQWNIPIPPNPVWYCNIANTVIFAAVVCSTLLILSMTFGRFYSVVQPHKAASFNTIKRAKVTIFCIVLFSILYNIPHLFISTDENWQCLPYGKAHGKSYGQFYYWFSFVLNFALPFVLLLFMNSVIIHKIRTRYILTDETDGSQRKSMKSSTSEKTNVCHIIASNVWFFDSEHSRIHLYVVHHGC